MRLVKGFLFFIFSVAVTGCATKYEIPEPTITSIAPESGPPGRTVTINGTSFGDNPSASINGTTIFISKYTRVGGNPPIDQIVFVVPGGASSGRITVFNGKYSVVSTKSFTVLP